MEMGEISLREQHSAMKRQGSGSVPPLQGDVFNKDTPELRNKTISPLSSDSELTSMSDDGSELTSITEDGSELPQEVDSLDAERLEEGPGLGEAKLEDLSSTSPSQSPMLTPVLEDSIPEREESSSSKFVGELDTNIVPSTTSEAEKQGQEMGPNSISHKENQELLPISNNSAEQSPKISSDPQLDDDSFKQSPKMLLDPLPNEDEGLTSNTENGAKVATMLKSDVLPPTNFLTYVRKGIGTIFIILGICCLVASLAITYPIIVPLVENIMLANLTITDATEGFSFNQIEDAPNVTWYFWNITNHEEFVAGTSPPALEQLGPYVLHQKMRTFAVNFSDDGEEVYRSSAIFGEYITDESCATCSLNDIITMVNNAYLYFTGLYASESQLLQQYIPNVIRSDLSKIADYLRQHGFASSTAQAKDKALQQWADCSVLSSDSIRQRDASWLYYPEICGWAHYVEFVPSANISKSDAQYILYDSSYALLDYKFGDEFAIQNLFMLVFPRGMESRPQKLFKLDITQTLRVTDYVTYLTVYAAKFYFENIVMQNNGLFTSRTVNEILFGYYDPILEDYYGNQEPLAFVATLNHISQINKNPRTFIEFGGYTGFKTGKNDAKETFSMVQQGTNLGGRAHPVNKRVIDWDRGSVHIYGSSGAFFGPGAVQRNKPQIIWMDLLNRHLVLDYLEDYKIDNLNVYRYGLSDFSLQACDEIPDDLIEEEGPCLYPQKFQGLFDITGFESPYYLTLPHFLRADPELKYTLGPAGEDMSTNSSWDMFIDIEPFWGVSIGVSIMFQSVIGLNRTDILRPDMWLNTDSLVFPETIWLPVSIIATQITPNETLVHSLWVGKTFIYAVIFLLQDLVPFCAVAVILYGFNILWRKTCFVKDRLKGNEIPEEKIVVAEVIDPVEVQIEQRTLARVIPSFEEMLALLEKLRLNPKPPPSPVSPGRDRKLSILVEEETKRVERPKSPRGSKVMLDLEVRHTRPSKHASFFIHDHEQQSLLESRKSRHARRSKASVQEAFVQGPEEFKQKPVSAPTVPIEVEPMRKDSDVVSDSSTPLFELSQKHDLEDKEAKSSIMGPALLGDISPRE